jgi:crotonobetainyl-CoA:carnitine CoA-transferase CaiB-like acyl-CoA transferase
VLEGYRVVEMGMWVAGPAAGGLLADWGADVVKVETPVGDPMRRLFALLSGHGQPESPPFDLDNRAKRSIVVDLNSSEGCAVLDRLLGDADVFLTNLRPDAVERLGFGPDRVLADHPRVVYASVTGHGLRGDDKDRASFDVGAFWARSGMADLTLPDGEAPPMVRSGLGDHITATTAVAGVLAALLERERTGRGQLVETSLLRTGIYTIGWDLGIQARFGKMAPVEPRSRCANPMCNCYLSADGHWFWLLGVEADRLWPKLCPAIGREDLADDERYSTARARRHNAVELIALLDEHFGARTLEELTDAFDEHDVWWAPVNRPAEVLQDAQALAIDAFIDVPEGAASPSHRGVNTPVTFHGTPTRAPRPPPALGEHTDAVLRDAGYSPDEIAKLRADGTVA